MAAAPVGGIPAAAITSVGVSAAVASPTASAPVGAITAVVAAAFVRIRARTGSVGLCGAGAALWGFCGVWFVAAVLVRLGGIWLVAAAALVRLSGIWFAAAAALV